jgi:ABC-2 type transport system permease protein
LIVAAVVLFASMLGAFGLPGQIRRTDPAQSPSVSRPFSMAPAPIMLTTFIVGLFYSLDALYGERRDRSILFWKSLPVSDAMTVLSKAAIPLAVLPLVGFLLSVVTVTILMMWGTMILLASGVSPAALWAEHRFFQGPIIMFYGLAAHTLWFAPIYAWLMLISAWAKRAPFLWAVLPPLAVAALERLAFGTTFFVSMLQYRVAGAMAEAFTRSDGNIHRVTELAPLKFLSAAGLWVGLLMAAAFLALAVRLRRNREPI